MHKIHGLGIYIRISFIQFNGDLLYVDPLEFHQSVLHSRGPQQGSESNKGKRGRYPLFEGIPHHITQRGNRREEVFFTKEDRLAYLAWLREYTEKHRVQVLVYCLMTNHIHLIVIPNTQEGLHKVLKPLHMRYAQRLNR
ncbi:MAG: hypothetical protein GY790_18930, partial [Bacteroidetes bacterium]|nr:hypothetical protein [Bacteroidota bacterium]